MNLAVFFSLGDRRLGLKQKGLLSILKKSTDDLDQAVVIVYFDRGNFL